MRLARSIEDADSIAANAINLSIVYQRMGRSDGARASLDAVREQDGKLVFPPDRLAQVALRRAVLDMDEQKFPSAAGWVERAAAYCKNCPLSAGIHNVRAQLALEGGDIDNAIASGRAGLSASRSSGDRAETANALRVLGLAAIRTGDAAAAFGFLDEALVVDREIAVPRKIYLDLVALGRAKALGGDRKAALSYYERAFVVSDAARDSRGAAEARALIEAINERRDTDSSGTPAATVESHAGQ